MDKNLLDEITAISTAAAAVFTAIMALLTRRAIKEGQGQRKETNDHFALTRSQDKQHHEDAFRPLLVLTASSSSETYERGELVEVSTPRAQLSAVFVNCLVRNIGSGPALNVRLSVRSDRRTGFGPSRELSPVAANGVISDGGSRIEMLVVHHDGDGFNVQDVRNLPNGLWLLVLEYQDVFGNTFHTIHSKHSVEPWTRVGRGFAPDLTPHQPGLADHVAAAPQEDPSELPGMNL